LAALCRGKTNGVLTHQTIRLIRGRHSSPDRGACVMEVASMLADEPFSDEPRCVCPVIAEFLRTYNDEVDHARRQDLLAYASLVVDTRKGPRVERQRANQCLDWWYAQASPRHRGVRQSFWRLAPPTATRDIEIAHRAARWAAADASRHDAALSLVESMTGRAPLRIEAAEPRERQPSLEQRDAEAVLALS
jgi:hypothetical protein